MYSLPESTLVLVSDLAPVPQQFNSHTSLDFDPGSKRALVPGAREAPLYVARGSASPKVTLELNSAPEYWRIWAACGGAAVGGGTCTFQCALFSVAAAKFDDWQFYGIILPAPGFKIDDGGTKFKIEMLPTYVEWNGAPIYAAS